MVEFDKKKLSKLSPRERLKKLKQIEEERKSEATEIGSLITESLKEIKTDEFASEIAPDISDVNIGSLFDDGEEKLEKTVKTGAKESDEEPLRYISVKEAYEDYKQIREISYVSIMGTMDEGQMEVLDQLGEKLDKTKYVSASTEATNLLVASRTVIDKIRKYAGLGSRSF